MDLQFAPVRPAEHKEAAIRAMAHLDRLVHTAGMRPHYRRAIGAVSAWLRASSDRSEDLVSIGIAAMRLTHRATEQHAEDLIEMEVRAG